MKVEHSFQEAGAEIILPPKGLSPRVCAVAFPTLQPRPPTLRHALRRQGLGRGFLGKAGSVPVGGLPISVLIMTSDKFDSRYLACGTGVGL